MRKNPYNVKALVRDARTKGGFSMCPYNSREYFIMIMSGILTMFSGGFVWPIFASYVRTEFSAPLQLVGLAVSGYFLLRMLTEFPIGVLSDTMGPKAPLIAGRILAVFGAFVSFQTKSIGILIFARVIWGIGDASFFCIGTSYVSKLFASEKRGRALGVFQAAEMAVSALAMVTLIKGRTGKPFGDKISSLMPSWGKIRRILNKTVVVICFVNLVSMVIMNGLLGTILPIFATENLHLRAHRKTTFCMGIPN